MIFAVPRDKHRRVAGWLFLRLLASLMCTALVPTGCEEQAKPLAGLTVIVDPGHGGKDAGVPGGGVSNRPEKVIVLAISREMIRGLTARGATTIATRTTDVFVTLDARAKLADQHRADLFVSVHADSVPDAGVRGGTIYIGRQASQHSLRAAECIQAALAQAGIKCRGIRRQDFRVLVGHSRPAVLVECGYLTNAQDARNLNTTSYQARFARALVEGIAAFLGGETPS